jgi:hypothetical protein
MVPTVVGPLLVGAPGAIPGVVPRGVPACAIADDAVTQNAIIVAAYSALVVLRSLIAAPHPS